MTETILVTGGSGFIATHTILKLLGKGYRVRATVRSDDKGEKLQGVISDNGGGEIELAEADLLEDEGWRAAMAGCSGLFHMASPFPAGSPDDEDELIKPALEGTRRVLKTAHDAGIKRAVLTSSVAAVAYGTPARPEGSFTEDDWTDPDGDVTAYVKSKTLAERAAWDLVKEQGGPALSVINPSLVLGPMVEDDHGTSVGLVRAVLSGKMDELRAQGLGVVDVRDVAEAHVLAYEKDAAIGERFIASSDFMAFEHIAQVLREAFPDRADTITSKVADGEVEPRAPSSKKASDILGIDFISGRDAIIATAESLIRRGLA